MYGGLPTYHRPPQNQRLSSEVVGNKNLFITMYGGSQQTTDRRKISGFRPHNPRTFV